MASLKEKITEDMKSAMKAKDKERLGTIRLMLSAMKQKEVDERIELTDQHVLAILNKMLKQRRDSITQYQKAERDDLVKQEQIELELITTYLPPQMTEEEMQASVSQAIEKTGASSMKEMGKVMGSLKVALEGRADMSKVSQLIKAALSG
jgi:hypothetical protein